ncbi:hypothetical protein Agabi119p4_2430 [Agaricus bisporus var. burnettii]|uniref:Uncharacterized protein n=1 Tax=Agaricus bisporus var. burnettii TaxID=192524 RepID=A0A8H7F9G1_AGABI|nr:hypothetical protein Agabi119p4_2430 [Agaricus bisporus var. burnettii]
MLDYKMSSRWQIPYRDNCTFAKNRIGFATGTAFPLQHQSRKSTFPKGFSGIRTTPIFELFSGIAQYDVIHRNKHQRLESARATVIFAPLLFRLTWNNGSLL